MSEMGLPFAMAILDLASEQEKEKQWQDQLNFMADAVSSDSDYLLALESPGVNRDLKKQWLRELFSDQVDDTLLDMLTVAVDYDAAGDLPAIAQSYRQLYERRLGIIPVTVTSAIALDTAQAETLQKKLEQQLKAPVRLTLETDPSLMGGMIIQTPDYLQDLSVRGQLESMKEQLHRE